jgi:3-oxoacyl-[acyl-carrier protein] reductase
MPGALLDVIYPDLRGKTALVTGAGTVAGIGAAVCRALADQGCNIFFTYYSAANPADSLQVHEGECAETLLSDLRARGARSECMGLDLSDARSAESVLNAVYASLGALSILVNNAAHSTHDGFEELTPEILDLHYFVNLRATALLSAGFAKRFRAGAGGRIINLTSGQDLGAMPGELAYAATKGAIAAFTRSLAKGVAHKGITVNAIDPGPTDAGWMTPDFRARLLEESRFRRLGHPQDAARLIIFLASNAGEWITGQLIHSRGDFA